MNSIETRNSSDTRPINIMLVEDSPSDAELLAEAMETIKASYSLSILEDGVKAMAFLRREGINACAPRPDLILLDLNMPRKDGREVLAEIKGDLAFRHIPVIVLTTSEAEKDIHDAYALHANCYIVKPIYFYEFLKVVESINTFWLSVAQLPSAVE